MTNGPRQDDELDVVRVGRVAVRDRQDELTLVDVMNVLLRYRWLIVVVSAVSFVSVATITLIQRRTYTSFASFTPQTEEGATSRLAGLAAQFGFSVPSGGGSRSPDFYVALLQSRTILGAVVDSTFSFRARTGRLFGDTTTIEGTLAEIWEIDKSSAAKEREAAIDQLYDVLTVRLGREAGIVTVAAATWWPELSEAIIAEMVRQVERFNREVRQSDALNERMFVEQRLEEAHEELRGAEDSLRVFLEGNRDFRNSPQLSLEHDRLQRSVGHRQQLVTALAQSYDQVRMDEARNTPIITIVETPVTPALPDRRGLKVKAMLAGVGGLVMGSLIALLVEAVARARFVEPDRYAEFQNLRKETVKEVRRMLRHPVRFLRDPSGNRSGG